MKVKIETHPEPPKPTYPKLYVHLGAVGQGLGSWRGAIALAVSYDKGVVLYVPEGALEFSPSNFVGSFSDTHWAEFKGQITLSNDDNAVDYVPNSTDRNIDLKL